MSSLEWPFPSAGLLSDPQEAGTFSMRAELLQEPVSFQDLLPDSPPTVFFWAGL